MSEDTGSGIITEETYEYKVPYQRIGRLVPIFYTLTFIDRGDSLIVAFNHEGYKETWKAVPMRSGQMKGYKLVTALERIKEPRIIEETGMFTSWQSALEGPMRNCRIRRLGTTDAMEWKLCVLPVKREEWEKKKRDGKRKAHSNSDWWYSYRSLGTYVSGRNHYRRVERYNRA